MQRLGFPNMVLLKNTVIFCSVILLLGCAPKRNEKVVNELYKNETFDSTVISKLYLYESLRNYLVANVDTIMKFRNSRNFVEMSDKNNKRVLVQVDEYSYSFNVQSLKDDLPLTIYHAADSICTKIGKDDILSFTFGWDGNKRPDFFVAEVKYDYIKDQCTKKYHELTYFAGGKSGSYEENGFVKNIWLNDHWNYTITFVDDCGW